jgi:dipeptidyl aminopeptidase/acylaminoacyl peptidase
MSLHTLQSIRDVTQVDTPIIDEADFNQYPDYYNAYKSKWSKLHFYRFEYTSNDHTVIGYLVEPKEGTNLSTIIYNRGGTQDIGKIDDTKLFYLMADLAEAGHVVIGSQYSGNDGGEGKDESGGDELFDVLNLKTIIDEHDKCDQSRIGMYGASRGGLMTYLSLSKVDWIKAAVIKSAPTNEQRSLDERPELKELIAQCYDINDPKEVERRSPIKWASKLNNNTPILLFHGTEDDKVNVLDTIEMSVELQKNSIPFEMHIYQGGHRLKKQTKTIMRRVEEWFDFYLK